MHGPISAVAVETPLAPEEERASSILLSGLGKRQEKKYDEFRRAQQVRERLLFGVQGSEFGVQKNAQPPSGFSALSTQHSALSSGSSASAANAAVKIGVRDEGWYRITQPELVAAGLDPSIDPRRLRLFTGGKELAILVTGQEDGSFDVEDSIEFYGTGVDTPFTDIRTYRLTPGNGLGKRIKIKPTKNWKSSSLSFPCTVEIKDRSIYVAALKNGDVENFFGTLISAEPADLVLKANHLDPWPPGEAVLEISLQGVTSANHYVRVLFNDSEITEMDFEGMTSTLAILPLPQSVLLEGDNLVTLVAEGGQTDVSFVDHIRLTYWRTYAVDEDLLKFTVPPSRRVVIEGLSSPLLRVMDVTNPTQVQEVSVAAVPWGAGYGAEVGVTGNGKRSFLTFTETRIKQPVTITADQLSIWRTRNNRADLVIVTHRDFVESLEPLKALRESQGWSVAVVNVEDIYDEFSFGQRNPKAVKDFLMWARSHWRGPPKYVLLVGDASFDPRNYLGFGAFDYVPTKLVDTAYLETASDDWFVDFKGDGLPDIPIGRIPVRTADETTLIVSKIIAYESAGPGNWARQALIVSDKMEPTDPFNFEVASREVITLLPGHLTLQEIFRSQADDETTRNQIIAQLNKGNLLVDYLGHGSVELWRGDVFTSDDAALLTNESRLPLVITMTCLNGFFHDSFPTESLAESLLKAEQGGSVAVWASSGFTEPENQFEMNKEIVRLLFDGSSRTIGETTMRAKTAVSDPDVRRTWILFGDPTMRLKD